MAELLKIKVEFSREGKALLHFITETQEGKYTAIKPDLTQIKYKRLNIHELEIFDSFDTEENLLLGVM